MAETTDPAGGNDAEALKRITGERDQAREQLAEATRVLSNYQRRDVARGALKGKVEDPDSVADLIAPHLAEIKLEDVTAHIASEGFAPRLAAFKAAVDTPPPAGDEPPGGEQPAATETPGFGGGPSPGQTTGTIPVTGEQKIAVGSEEYNRLVETGSREELAAAYKADRILEPRRGF